MRSPAQSMSNKATARPSQSQRRYIPGRGDIIWIDLEPQGDRDQKGHEQRGYRKAVVLSHREKNEKTGMAFVCPITTQKKGLDFEVEIKESPGKDTRGVALVYQCRSVDWTEREIEFSEKAPSYLMEAIMVKFLDWSPEK